MPADILQQRARTAAQHTCQKQGQSIIMLIIITSALAQPQNRSSHEPQPQLITATIVTSCPPEWRVYGVWRAITPMLLRSRSNSSSANRCSFASYQSHTGDAQASGSDWRCCTSLCVVALSGVPSFSVNTCGGKSQTHCIERWLTKMYASDAMWGGLLISLQDS
jgi:hypothetical protein